MATPSLEVIVEMVKNLKEESLATLHVKLDSIQKSLENRVNGVEDDVESLKKFRDEHVTETNTMRRIGGITMAIMMLIFTALGTFIAWVTMKNS